MKVSELMDALRSVDGDTDIRVAVQPSYPMEASLVGVVLPDAALDDDDECDVPDCYDARSNHPGGGACVAKDLDTDEPCQCTGWVREADVAGPWLVISDQHSYGVSRDLWDRAERGW